VAEGAELLAASEDLEAIGAVVGLMTEEDLEIGLEIARTAGELWAVSDVVELLEMPVLSAFLEQRGESLQEVAVEIILQAAGTRALSQVLGATSAKVGDLGAGEVAEGLVRGAASQAMAERLRAKIENTPLVFENGQLDLAAEGGGPGDGRRGGGRRSRHDRRGRRGPRRGRLVVFKAKST